MWTATLAAGVPLSTWTQLATAAPAGGDRELHVPVHGRTKPQMAGDCLPPDLTTDGWRLPASRSHHKMTVLAILPDVAAISLAQQTLEGVGPGRQSHLSRPDATLLPCQGRRYLWAPGPQLSRTASQFPDLSKPAVVFHDKLDLRNSRQCQV